MIRTTTGLTAGILLISVASFAFAEDEQQDRIKIAPKAERVRPATSIDFNYELGLSFESLTRLGKQIEDARTAADPVGLAASAQLLAAAEKAAGGDKQAPLTSKELQTEAVELAKLRAVPSELDALAVLTGDSELNTLARAARERDAQLQKELEEDAVSKDLDGDLHVINHSHEGFRIYANGHFIGYVGPHGQFERHLHGIHYLDARNHYHHLHRHIHGHHHHYDFYIHIHH